MKEIAIEIGPRNDPTIEWLRSDLNKNTNIVYVGDIFSQISDLKKDMRRSEFINADGRRLPFENGSIKTIYLRDVLGFIYPTLNYPSYSEYLSSDRFKYERDAIDAFSGELERVCKKGGRVVINEMGTPANENYVVDQFKKVGFELMEFYRGNDTLKVFNKIIQDAQLPYLGDEYSLVFRKK